MSANIILEKHQVLFNNFENNLLSMRGKITTLSIVAILSIVLFTSSFSAANADPQSDFDNCPPPEGVFIRITVFSQDGTVEGTKTFSAESYSTSKTEGGTGTVSKLPDEHSQQLNDSVGKQVTVEIVDCGDGESPYRHKTTLTGGTIDIFSQSGGSSGPTVETITFSFSKQEPEPTTDKLPEKQIVPSWIKNNAGWWSQGAIDDKNFVEGIQYMLKEDIIDIPELPLAGRASDQPIPSWIKNNAGWWADGLISEDDFVGGIKWLVENGIIRV